MYMALAMSRHIDQSKVEKLLEERLRETEHQVNLAYQVYEEHISIVPRSALHLMYGTYEHTLTELKWLQRLYDDVVARKLKDVGTPLNLEACVALFLFKGVKIRLLTSTISIKSQRKTRR